MEFHEAEGSLEGIWTESVGEVANGADPGYKVVTLENCAWRLI